jgi:uncharacterized repeat protein (TIGR02543 family)
MELTVEFDSNDGNPVLKAVYYGDPISKPADPTRAGWIFTGRWLYDDAGVQREWNFATPVTTNLKLYAQWTLRPEVTVIFDVNHDRLPPILTTTAHYNGLVTDRPADPTWVDHTFAGWYKEAEGTNVWDFGSNVATEYPTILYAHWNDKETFTIFYENLGDATNDNNPKSFTEDTILLGLKDPGERRGYLFKGWFTDEELTFPVLAPAIPLGTKENIKFYAKWDYVGIVTDIHFFPYLPGPAGNEFVNAHGRFASEASEVIVRSVKVGIAWNLVTQPSLAQIVDVDEGWRVKLTNLGAIDWQDVYGRSSTSIVEDRENYFYVIYEKDPTQWVDVWFEDGDHGTVNRHGPFNVLRSTLNVDDVKALYDIDVVPEAGYSFTGWTRTNSTDGKEVTFKAQYVKTPGAWIDVYFADGVYGTVNKYGPYNVLKTASLQDVITIAGGIVATPQEGFTHTGWGVPVEKEGTEGNDPTRTYTAQYEKTLGAWIDVYFSDGDHGTVNPKGPFNVLIRTFDLEEFLKDQDKFLATLDPAKGQPKITVTPEPGYRQTGWLTDSTAYGITYTPTFEKIPEQWATVTFFPGEGGKLIGEREFEVYVGPDGISWQLAVAQNKITIPEYEPDDGYKFAGWDSFPITLRDGLHVFTAYFVHEGNPEPPFVIFLSDIRLAGSLRTGYLLLSDYYTTNVGQGPAYDYQGHLEFISSDERIATVDKTGRVTFHDYGYVIISVSAYAGNSSAPEDRLVYTMKVISIGT